MDEDKVKFLTFAFCMISTTQPGFIHIINRVNLASMVSPEAITGQIWCTGEGKHRKKKRKKRPPSPPATPLGYED